MQLDNRQAILFLITLELCVELAADLIQRGVTLLPWTVFNQTVSDGLICLVMMALIIIAIFLLEPQAIEQSALSLWRKIRVLYRFVKARLKRKTVAKH